MPSAVHASPGLASATILVVDDVPANLAVIGSLLQDHGYRVLAAQTGEAALTYARRTPAPDLVLLDVLMPGMDGHEVLRRLRDDPRTAQVPVVFLTALDEPHDEEVGLSLGAADYIAKPILPAVVLARVRTQLQAAQARRFLTDQNTFLEAEVARRMVENELTQAVSIRALAHLAEIRDPETGYHILRTQNYVVTLGRQLSALPQYRERLAENIIAVYGRSAPLHDIGKVGIPDRILLKPGKLDDDEWVVMKTHAAMGARAIELAEQDAEQPVEFLRVAKEIAHWHHEKWDGSGYPDGLRGPAIPLAARLMALADVFDALTTPRVYKQPMSCDQARAIIRAGRGTHFDPDVVDAFEIRYDEFCAIAARYAETAGVEAAP